MARDTIYALSTGPLPSAIAIVRVSGPMARTVASTLAGPLPEPARASLRTFRTAAGDVIDQGLLLRFEAPHSATGEDCCEFHCHGGPAVVAAMMREIGCLAGLRLAEAGEFTRRALLNGRMDLAQVESLGDLLDAETDAQRRLALRGVTGSASALYHAWAERLTLGRAMIEAELDFADEGDVPDEAAGTVWADLAALEEELTRHLSGAEAAEIARDGFRVVIMGPPNAGKSSLINTLSRREAAIVSDEPGTTRDLVEVVLTLGGQKVIVTDTAGIREKPGVVEAIGIQRAHAAATEAQLVIWLDPADAEPSVDAPASAVRMRSKCDVLPDAPINGFSSLTGIGLDQVNELIAQRAALATSQAFEGPLRLRHASLVSECLLHLRSALDERGHGLEIRAEQLRLASDALGCITGRVGVEDLLDRIFSSFCIGK